MDFFVWCDMWVSPLATRAGWAFAFWCKCATAFQFVSALCDYLCLPSCFFFLVHEKKSKSNVFVILAVLVEEWNEYSGLISASLHLQATQLLLRKSRSGGEPLAILSNLIGPRFKPHISPSRDSRYFGFHIFGCEINRCWITKQQICLPYLLVQNFSWLKI